MPIKLTDKKRLDVPPFPTEGLKLAGFESFSLKKSILISPMSNLINNTQKQYRHLNHFVSLFPSSIQPDPALFHFCQ
jgi:hypothetical protein